MRSGRKSSAADRPPRKINNHAACTLLLALVLGVASGGWTPVAAQPTTYPGWFLETPRDAHALFAVGYARDYDDARIAYARARADARTRLRHARRLTLRGEQLFETLPGRGAAFRGDSFTEEAAIDSLRHVAFLDSMQTAGMTLVLAAWHPDGQAVRLDAASAARCPMSAAPPAWTRHAPRPERGVRAVGVAPRYFYPESSWDAAERHARQQLALHVTTQFRQLHRFLDGSLHTVMAARTDVVLHHVQVLARWQDDAAAYVLVEAAAALPTAP